MSLNRFDMLSRLRKGEYKNWMEENFKFSLTGVIVHDIENQSLRQCIQQNLENWSDMTGEHFLFITFVAPETCSQSKFSRQFYNFNREYLATDDALNKESEEVIIPLVRKMYGLPKRGSYLLLSENIESNVCTAIPINKSNIEGILRRITSYCEQGEHSPADYKQLEDDLLGKGKGKILNMAQSMIHKIVDTISLIFKNREFGNCTQADHVMDSLKRLREEAKGKKDAEQRIFEISEYIVYLYEHGYNVVKNEKSCQPLEPDNISEPLNLDTTGFTHIGYTTSFEVNDRAPVSRYNWEQGLKNEKTIPNYDKLEEVSKKLYRSYVLFKKAVGMDSTVNEVGDSNNFDDIDYSGLTIYLGKIVENEFYCSVGQMLREIIGIEMPRYFAVCCYELGEMNVKAGKKWVNLNPQKASIPMGDLLHVYIEFENGYRRNIITKRFNADFRYFIYITPELYTFMDEFSKHRNISAHVDLDSETTYHDASQQFLEFTKTHLKELYSIRQAVLRG